MERATIKIDSSITNSVTRRCIPIEKVSVNENGYDVMKVIDSCEKGDEIKSIVIKHGKAEVLDSDMSSGEYKIDILKWWDDNFEYQIFGRSDDLVEVRGFCTDEFYCAIDGSVLEVGETLVKVYLNDEGNWEFDVLSEGKENLIIKSLDSDVANMFCEYSELLCISYFDPIEEPNKI